MPQGEPSDRNDEENSIQQPQQEGESKSSGAAIGESIAIIKDEGDNSSQFVEGESKSSGAAIGESIAIIKDEGENSSQFVTIECERTMLGLEEDVEKVELYCAFDAGTGNKCKSLDENNAMEDVETLNLNEEIIGKEKKLGFTVVEVEEEETREIVCELGQVAQEKEVVSEYAVVEEKQIKGEEDVVAEGSDVEAQDDQGECEQKNGDVNQSANRDEDTYQVKEATPAHGEEALVLRENYDIVVIDVDDESDAEGEYEKTKNDNEEEEEKEEEEECDEDNENGEPTVLGGGDDIPGVEKEDDKERKDKKSEDSDDGNEECFKDNVDEGHLSEYIYHSLSFRKESVLEVHVGGLDKAAVEDDLIKIFAKFGEIQEVRIARNSHKKSKGFGFIRFVTGEQAKNALLEFKDGIKIRGKLAQVSASQDNNTLYIGNIRKSWRKEKVCETLKGFGIKVEDMYLPDDPEKDGRIRGYAFMNFSNLSDTMEAFKRLSKPDAIFGCARSAKVAFIPAANEEVLAQIKTVYVESLPIAWDDEKVREICKQYGEIEKVKLSRNLKRKRKDFGFVTFTSRENALACVDGINSSRIGEGKLEVKANMAKSPQGRLQMRTRGGYNVEKGQEETSHAESNEAVKGKLEAVKGKEPAQDKGKASLNSERGGRVKSIKRQSSVFQERKNGKPSKESRNSKRKKLPLKPDGRGTRGKESDRRERDMDSGRRDVDRGYNKRPSKKARGDIRGKFHTSDKAVHASSSAVIRAPYTLRDDASASSYPRGVYGASSRIKRHHSDMEPHAGFLETAEKTRTRDHELAVGTRDQRYASYIEPLVREPYLCDGIVESHLGRQVRRHVDYIEPVPVAPILPRARYLAPAIGNQTPSLYEYGTRRVASRYADHGIRDTDYAGGSDLQSAYALNDTSYTGRQGGSGVGSYYQTSRSTLAQLPRRPTYY